MGFPVDMFTVLFATRTAGWLAHWQELLADKDQKIHDHASGTLAESRDYVPLPSRS